MKRKTKEKESVLQKAIIDYLNKIGIIAWRNNTGAFKLSHGGKSRFVRFGLPGAADIFGVLKDGRFIAIEIKRKGMVPTELQMRWMDWINGNGAWVFWVDSWKAFETVCRDKGWPI
jgi:hypothetical protein